MSKQPDGSGNKAIDSIQERLTSYARDLNYNGLPPQVIHAVKVRVIDTFGALICAFFSEPCRIARNLAAQMPDPDGATVIGTRMKTTPDMAAFVNSTTSRYMELNDAYQWPGSSRGHPSDTLTPLLAVAEHAGLGGPDFITSVVLAYEVFMHFSDALRNIPGIDNTTCGCLGTAIGAGKLLGLSAAALSHCISMAVVPNVILRQVRRDSNSMFKAVSAGQAGRAGVFAALLARAGMEGPHLPFEGKAGWCDHVARARFALPTMGGNGTPFKILATGIKNRASNALTLSPIAAAEKVAPTLKNIKDVNQVTVEVYKLAKDDLGTAERHWNPQSREDADHSMAYVIAASLMDGRVTPRSFDEAHLSSPELRALMQKIEVIENAEFTRAYQRLPQEHRARVTVTTHGGERLVGEGGGGEEDLAVPKSDDQIEEKFRELTEDFLGSKRVNVILARLWQLEDIENVAEIPRAFVLG